MASANLDLVRSLFAAFKRGDSSSAEADALATPIRLNVSLCARRIPRPCRRSAQRRGDHRHGSPADGRQHGVVCGVQMTITINDRTAPIATSWHYTDSTGGAPAHDRLPEPERGSQARWNSSNVTPPGAAGRAPQ